MAQGVKPCPQLDIISSSYDEPSLVFLAGTDTRLLTDANAAAAALRQDRCAVALIDREHQPRFLATFTNNAPQAQGEIKAYNIGNGKTADLFAYTLPAK
jgi:hypothetical protein